MMGNSTVYRVFTRSSGFAELISQKWQISAQYQHLFEEMGGEHAGSER